MRWCRRWGRLQTQAPRSSPAVWPGSEQAGDQHQPTAQGLGTPALDGPFAAKPVTYEQHVGEKSGGLGAEPVGRPQSSDTSHPWDHGHTQL